MNRRARITLALTLTLVVSSCGPTAAPTHDRKPDSTSESTTAGSQAADTHSTEGESAVPTKAIEAAMRAANTRSSSPAATSRAAAPPPTAVGRSNPDGFVGSVTETLDASSYTYVHVTDGNKSAWAASLKFKVQVGDQVLIPRTTPMLNFHSSTLNRTFEVIYFCDSIQVAARPEGAGPEGAAPDGATAAHDATVAPTSPSAPPVAVGVTAVAGGLTVAEVHAQPRSKAGQQITVRGRVVKYNQAILGRNWIHIQDGSGGPGTNDITVTTSQSAAIGATVTIRGTLAFDKDFGAGYRYPIIIEQATVTSDSP